MNPHARRRGHNAQRKENPFHHRGTLRRPAGAAQYQKFLGMGVWGKGLLSRSPFPRNYISVRTSRNAAQLSLSLGFAAMVRVSASPMTMSLSRTLGPSESH